MAEKKLVEIFTDGACCGNPGPGGWAAILRFGQREKELSGGEKETTNNRMELLAAIQALEALNQPCIVKLCTDSQYLANGINKGWVFNWQKKGWKKADNSPVLNPELWQRLLKAMASHKVEIIWVKGHAGHPENERCDQLATAQARHFQTIHSPDAGSQ